MMPRSEDNGVAGKGFREGFVEAGADVASKG